MGSAEQNESESYRVIVLGRGGTEVLLVDDGKRFVLPFVEIPRWRRVAENITGSFQTDWGAEIVCLFQLPSGSSDEGGFIQYEAAEYLRSTIISAGSAQWVAISALHREALKDVCDFTAIKRAVGICHGEIGPAVGGPFSRIGWFTELRNWVEAVTEPMGVQLTGRFKQLNASPFFCLIRFESNGPGLWFKAVGEPNQREFAITCLLSRIFPSLLPPVLAIRPDWNGWLSRETEGQLLYDVQERQTWHRVAAELAELQINSRDQTSSILAAGARDLRVEALSKQIGPFVDTTQRLMEQQAKNPPGILEPQELRLLADRVRDAFNVLLRTQVPDTLGHLDFNPGNVVVSSKSCVFLDWADAYVGNPFLTFQYLLEHFQRAYGEDSSEESRLIESYATRWLQILPREAVDVGLAVSRLLAVFSYACGTGMISDEKRQKDPEFAGYLRSLARRMAREAHVLADRSSKCITHAAA